jgi:hypothetical protein
MGFFELYEHMLAEILRHKILIPIFSGLFFLLFFVQYTNAQQLGNLTGKVVDEQGKALFSASVGIEGTTLGTVTDNEGNFILKVPAGKSLILTVYYLGYKTYKQDIQLQIGETITLSVILYPEIKVLEDVEVFGIQQRENTLVPINIKSIDQLPNTSGNIEAIIKTLPGVASGNELSAQYSVRGGSFDENLVYVNDIEIYRPMLIQSAQQEGLSFVNPSMVSSIQFSAGGFDAEYGDKLSSVLDIRYKQPSDFSGSASASLLGGSVHIEGASKNHKFTHITGIRYKTTKFLLNTLDTRGDYSPSFADAQTFLTYDLTKKLHFSVLGNYATNHFHRQPIERETDFGTLQQTFTFRVYYEGEEKDHFDTYMGALAIDYQPVEGLSLKIIASGFQSNEAVTYDLLKQYWIGLATRGSGGLRDSLINIGVGSSLEHARDYLNSSIYSLEHKGTFISDKGITKWGIKIQQEFIDDKINEWQLLDSSGYSIPYSDEEINLLDVYRTSNTFTSQRAAAYAQHTIKIENSAGQLMLTIGLRSQYWTYNQEVTISPRLNFSYIPANRPNISLHIASGMYHQPPFYKELRDRQGNLYPDKKAQRAWHLVSGIDYNFQAWHRPFVFTSELYYKQMTRVIPYKLDDVRLQYLPMYNAKAYAAGVDFRVYGEFVSGNESWFSLSLLRTREDIQNDFIIHSDNTVEYPGYYRRPTDQWLNFSLFFQDYLPSNPNYKVHLMVNYGSGLSYSGPIDSRPSDIYRLDPYRRIDIGFSRLIVRNSQNRMGIKSIWISAEILNLLDAKNKVSLDWVRTVESEFGINAYFSVPNYLTGRIFNAKLTVDL